MTDEKKRPIQNGLYYVERAKNIRIDENKKIFVEHYFNKITHMIVEKEDFTDLIHAADLAVQYIRVVKERANADRELRPKKEHSGYVLLWQQYYEKPKDRGWKTCWQTPFDAKMPSDLVQDLFIKAFKNGCDELLDQLGGDNKVTKTEWRANYQKGYWELILTHKNELVFTDYDKINIPKEFGGCYERPLEDKMTSRTETPKTF